MTIVSKDKFMEKRKTIPYDKFKNITYGNVLDEEFVFFTGSKKLPLFIESVGITYPDKNYSIARKHSDYIVMEYIEDGIGYINSSSKKYAVSKGDVYILLPGTPHKYWADENAPFKKIWINFFSDIFVEIAYKYNLNETVVFHTNGNCKKYFEELLDLAKSNCNNDLVYAKASKIVFSIFMELVKIENNAATSNVLARKAYKMLSNRIYSEQKINEVAKSLNISVAYLIKVFKQEYGVTPLQFIIKQKIDLAKTALKTSDLPINAIARQLSFSDEHYFSTQFKKIVGMTPTKYRNNKTLKN